MVSGSYEHACINKTCSVHPPSWVSRSLHFVHFNVGSHLDGHQHGVSTQISINLGKTFIHINLNLGESICIFAFFLFPDSGLNILNGFDFLFNLICFEWRDTETSN